MMASAVASSLEHYNATMAVPQSRESDYFSHESIPAITEPERSRHNSSVPAGFPRSISSPAAWTGADFDTESSKERCSLQLNEAQIKEIEEAFNYFKGLGRPFEFISQETFPLPILGGRLKAFAAQLTSGVGFFHIRGLDPQRYSDEVNVVLYLGISSYIGEQRGGQDELGNMLLHLTDLGSVIAPESERQAPYSNVGQPFHTDTGDIIALYSLGEAYCGGESQLVSMATVYNELVKTRPDIIRLLSSPSWIFDRFGQWPPYNIRPILYPMPKGNVLFSFSRRPLVGSASSPRSRGIPDLSASHVEAIDTLQVCAEKHTLSMKLKRGDLLFWNNLDLLHSRRGFTDSPNCRRHLLRLWLRNDASANKWPIPRQLQASWKDAFDHAGREQLWPIQPIKDRGYICNQQRSSGHS